MSTSESKTTQAQTAPHTPDNAAKPHKSGTDLEPTAEAASSSELDTESGKTTIASVVVEKIAGMATREIPGVHKLGSGMARALGSLRERIPGQSSNIGQGVSVEVGERQAAVDLDIVVDYGASIVEVSQAIRTNVIDSVESMTGLEVTEVNIAVGDVHLPDEDDDEDSQEARVQ